MNNSSKEFDVYITELRNIFRNNPTLAIEYAQGSVERLKGINISEEIKSFINSDSFSTFLVVMIYVVAALFGVLEPNPLYWGGLIFFAAGVLVACKAKIFGLLFLFSHGMTGLGMMSSVFLYKIFSNPIYSDNPKKYMIGLAITFLFYGIGLVTSFIYNLSDDFKKKRFAIIYPSLFFVLGIIVLSITSII